MNIISKKRTIKPIHKNNGAKWIKIEPLVTNSSGLLLKNIEGINEKDNNKLIDTSKIFNKVRFFLK
ncbi:MAG: hypothetical protein ACLTAI_06735 [Thomasclavelia sp.]